MLALATWYPPSFLCSDLHLDLHLQSTTLHCCSLNHMLLPWTAQKVSVLAGFCSTINTVLQITQADKLRSEIYARGPISCGIDVTAKFYKYSGGIFEEEVSFPMPNHEISIVGWGEQDGHQ